MARALEIAIQVNIANNLENELNILNQRPREFHKRDDAFSLSDKQFIRLFRLKKERVRTLIATVEQFVQPSRSSALDATTQVLIALRFFASGSYQLDIGQNINMAVSQSSVSRSVHVITDILNRPAIFREWVSFPNNLQEIYNVRNKFWMRHRFPGAIGCIDCTHVAIFPPPTQDENFPEHIYINRKGYHSINVQLVRLPRRSDNPRLIKHFQICDPDLKIMNVNAIYPGSTHDSYIWNRSEVLPIMRDLHNRGHHLHLIGDSGYALRPWLMTPLSSENQSVPEARYSEQHRTTRSLIERCNGLLKMRFRCLLKHRVLHYAPDVCSRITNACVVLHNMCIMDNVPHPEHEEGDVGLELGFDIDMDDNLNMDVREQGRVNPELTAGRHARDNLIRQYFL